MAAGPDLETRLRDLAGRLMSIAAGLKANPDPAHPDHIRASAMESDAAMIRDLLNITSTGEDIDHDAATARARAEGLIPAELTTFAEGVAGPPAGEDG